MDHNKNNLLIYLSLIFMLSSTWLYAQQADGHDSVTPIGSQPPAAKGRLEDANITQPSVEEEKKKEEDKDQPDFAIGRLLTDEDKNHLNMIGGAEVQGGLGHFIDPTSPYGLSIAIQTGLGSATRSSGFGFDALAVKGRWKLGTNPIGEKMSLLFGAASWEPILPSKVYSADYLTEDEKNAENSSKTSFISGLAFTVGDRFPDDKAWGFIKAEDIGSSYGGTIAINNDGSLEIVKPDEKLKIDSEIKKEVWEKVYLPAFRSTILQFGILFRADDFSLDFEETGIRAVDIYSTVAKGHKWFDSAFSVHYFRTIGSSDDKDNVPIAKRGVLYTMGAFLDLDNLPPIRTMGLTLGLGYYNYAERFPVVVESEENGEIKPPKNKLPIEEPYTKELDVLISFAGFRDNTSAFGIRYEKFWNEKTEDEEKFSLLFSTDLVSHLKEIVPIGEKKLIR